VSRVEWLTDAAELKQEGLWLRSDRKKQGRFFRSQEQLRLNKSQPLLAFTSACNKERFRYDRGLVEVKEIPRYARDDKKAWKAWDDTTTHKTFISGNSISSC
jgi:hypothetical protein